mmetsp:Transcript_39176/g.70173  ORF Transcript_39176/g.70173 Transcript_39176/m.70173 type:complete len:351 (+) Transcript_39176:88-1140(+)
MEDNPVRQRRRTVKLSFHNFTPVVLKLLHVVSALQIINMLLGVCGSNPSSIKFPMLARIHRQSGFQHFHRRGLFAKSCSRSGYSSIRRPTVMFNTTTFAPQYHTSSHVMSSTLEEKQIETVFDLHLEHGRCVGVKIDRETPPTEINWRNDLFLEEEQTGLQLPPGIRLEFLAGRTAMRRALGEFSGRIAPILKNRHGAPSLPTYVRGSISHKKDIAVALVRPSSRGSVGVDLEVAAPPRRPNLANRVLTPAERARAGQIPHISAEVETLLHFSMKEALYKALHPHLHQYIGFQEAAVFPKEDGTFDIELYIKNTNKRFAAEGRWTLLDNNMFLTTAHVELVGIQKGKRDS